MKKKLFFKSIFIFLIIFNIKNVNAASASLYTSKSSVSVGESFTASVTINNTAAWHIIVNSNGPVSNCTINESDVSSTAGNITKTFSTTCTANQTGTIILTLSGDITSEDEKNSSISGRATVVVTAASNTHSNSSNNSSRNNTNQNVNVKDDRSSNNNLKTLSIKDYDLIKVDDVNYSLEVKNPVSKILIEGECEDSKAKVEGLGEKELVVGENNFEVIVVAENDTQKSYYIKVIRKDSKYLVTEIDDALKEQKAPIIVLKKDSVITKDILNKIKNSKKKVEFVYYDDIKKEKYTWIINGKSLSNIKEINPIINFNASNTIIKKLDYREGIVFSTNDNNKKYSGVTLRIDVSNKFKDKEKINVFYYDKKAKQFKKLVSDVVVKNGNIEISMNKGSKFFISKATILNKKNNNKVYKILSVVELYVILLIVICLIINKVIKKRKKVS